MYAYINCLTAFCYIKTCCWKIPITHIIPTSYMCNIVSSLLAENFIPEKNNYLNNEHKTNSSFAHPNVYNNIIL